jgi:DNA-binding NarL/FixJ family response regulator
MELEKRYETMNLAPDHVIKVLLVDDHAMFREGLARSLATERDLEVIGEVSSVKEALSRLNSSTDVVLLDVDLGAERALEFVERAKIAAFQGRILIVTAGISGREAVQLVQAGVAGILHKNHPTKVLCGAIRKVVAGEACIEDEYLTALFQSVDRASAGLHPKFTERDRVVLQHVLQGLTNREIAEKLEISEAAVKASLRQLFEKLGVHTRAQLVKIALEQYNGHL